MAGKVIDRDKGWRGLIQKIEDLVTNPSHVVIGVTGGAHRKSPGSTVAEIAAAHEFGTSRVPERSFIRSTLDKHGLSYASQMNQSVQTAIVDAARGRLPTKDRELKQLGVRIQGDIQKRIAEGIPPPNSPATIAQKKSSTPLIDSGQLRQSISFEIRKGRGR